MRTISNRTLLALVISLVSMPLRGAETEQKGDSIARRALVAGMTGNTSKKEELLHAALDKDPDNRLANWALGNIRVKGQWIASEGYESDSQNDSLLEAYRQHRNMAVEGKISELELANWCRSNKILDAEKLHLNNVLQSDSATPQQKSVAVRRLGLQNVAGRWMTPKELAAFRTSLREARSNHERWLPLVSQMIKKLKRANVSQANAIVKNFQGIGDATAINTIELLLSNQNEPLARVAVSLIGNYPEWEATESLVRYAIRSRWPAVRSQAIKELSKRDTNDVVPQLLSTLANPLEARYGIGVSADGMVRSGRYVHQEGREANTLFADVSARGPHRINVTELNVSRRNGRVLSMRNSDDLLVERALLVRPNLNREERIELELAIRTQLAIARRNLVKQEIWKSLGVSRQVGMQNQRTEEQNKRAIVALKQVTDADLDSDTPSAWWEWWNQQNERYQQEKPTYTRLTSYRDPSASILAPQAPPRLGTRSCECFPAGTLVRTQRGKAPIETIQPGDRVLSQNTETGELSYKIVMGTTERPPSSMVRIRLASGTVEATSGHLFWVQEHGWKMAKNLQASDLFHSLGDKVEVIAVEKIDDAVAYNLIVADFGTYFVAENEILVHDNSEQRRTRAISPGLISVN